MCHRNMDTRLALEILLMIAQSPVVKSYIEDQLDDSLLHPCIVKAKIAMAYVFLHQVKPSCGPRNRASFLVTNAAVPDF